MTLVSVIIPHRDDLENLRLCLDLLDRQTFRDFEIVVADNNSACGFAKVLDVCGPRALVVPAPLQGAAHARNAALAVALGRNLAFIDSDCRPAENWLERGLAKFARWRGGRGQGRGSVRRSGAAHAGGSLRSRVRLRQQALCAAKILPGLQHVRAPRRFRSRRVFSRRRARGSRLGPARRPPWPDDPLRRQRRGRPSRAARLARTFTENAAGRRRTPPVAPRPGGRWPGPPISPRSPPRLSSMRSSWRFPQKSRAFA